MIKVNRFPCIYRKVGFSVKQFYSVIMRPMCNCPKLLQEAQSSLPSMSAPLFVLHISSVIDVCGECDERVVKIKKDDCADIKSIDLKTKVGARHFDFERKREQLYKATCEVDRLEKETNEAWKLLEETKKELYMEQQNDKRPDTTKG